MEKGKRQAGKARKTEKRGRGKRAIRDLVMRVSSETGRRPEMNLEGREMREKE